MSKQKDCFTEETRKKLQTPDIISPYNLLQEELWKEKTIDWEWKILVTCMMLNQTSAKQVRGVMRSFFERYPTHMDASCSIFREMEDLLRPLGLQNRRTKSIRKMSAEYLSLFTSHWHDVSELHGIGKYASDSWKIFVTRELVDDVKDKELRHYVEWAKDGR